MYRIGWKEKDGRKGDDELRGFVLSGWQCYNVQVNIEEFFVENWTMEFGEILCLSFPGDYWDKISFVLLLLCCICVPSVPLWAMVESGVEVE